MPERSSHEKSSFSQSEVPTEQCTGVPNKHSTPGHLHTQPSINLTPEQYERLFFQPSSGHPSKLDTSSKRIDLSKQFGNPTAFATICFVMCLTPTSCFLLGFDGTTASSAIALTGVYYMIGGLGVFVGGILEWVLGNTFPFIVFCTFGGFWLAFGVLNDPAHMIAAAFEGGTAAREYNTGLMFYWIFWTVLVTIYFVASLRTNIVFVEIFTALWFALVFFAVGYHKLGAGDIDGATSALKIAGGFGLATVIGGWYLAFGLIMDAVDMPFKVPFGDLSTRFLMGKKKVYDRENGFSKDS